MLSVSRILLSNRNKVNLIRSPRTKWPSSLETILSLCTHRSRPTMLGQKQSASQHWFLIRFREVNYGDLLYGSSSRYGYHKNKFFRFYHTSISFSNSTSYEELIEATPTQKEREEDLSEKVSFRKDINDALRTMFGMSRQQAFAVICSPKLSSMPSTVLKKSLHCLKDHGITSEQLQRVPWILLQPSDLILKKMNLLCEPYLFLSCSDGLGFCHLSLPRIKSYQKFFSTEMMMFPKHNNRIYFMADNLMVPVDQLTEKIVKVQRLLFMDIQRIEAFIQILNKYNIDRLDILNDLWVFLNNMERAESRLQAIIAAGCKKPKPWMCRCREEDFNNSLSKYQSQKNVLGKCSSLEEYFTERLNCTKEHLQLLPDFNLVTRINAAKVQRVIDLLLAEGFTTNEILNSLRLLRYSEERTAKRIKLLKEMGVKKICIQMLYKTPKEFDEYYNSLVK